MEFVRLGLGLRTDDIIMMCWRHQQRQKTFRRKIISFLDLFDYSLFIRNLKAFCSRTAKHTNNRKRICIKKVNRTTNPKWVREKKKLDFNIYDERFSLKMCLFAVRPTLAQRYFHRILFLFIDVRWYDILRLFAHIDTSADRRWMIQWVLGQTERAWNVKIFVVPNLYYLLMFDFAITVFNFIGVG